MWGVTSNNGSKQVSAREFLLQFSISDLPSLTAVYKTILKEYIVHTNGDYKTPNLNLSNIKIKHLIFS